MRHNLLKYGAAIVVTLAALGMRLALDPVLGEHSPYLPFTMAVIVAAWFGGRGPGFTSTALGTLAAAYFLLPPKGFLAVSDLHDRGALILFMIVGAAISLLVGNLHNSLLAAAAEHRKNLAAEERMAKLQKLESIGLLAGGVAHDFNNLLTVVAGHADLALAGCPSCEHYTAVQKAAERATYLTRQLLAYAGKGHNVKRLVDLTDLVSQVSLLLSASVHKRVSLSYKLSPNLPWLEADPSRVEQILLNLVVNAGESVPLDRDGLIEIATSSCEVTSDMARECSHTYDVTPGSHVCLEVRDNGNGMDEATKSRIFDPFFSTKFTGRGLGLAAVQGIVRAKNGYMDVHSLPGVGTTFRVFLPASNKTPPTQEVAMPSKQVRHSVLVVEDEHGVRRLACTVLKRADYEVEEAEDGRQALRILTESAALPCVILLDLAMPIMSGHELLPILAKEYPQVKVILTSGYSEQDTLKELSSGGVAGFLQKPYMPDNLLEKIHAVLEAQ